MALRQKLEGRRIHARIGGFLKREKLPIVEGKEPLGRLISPRPALYTYELGRHLKHVEHHVYRRLGQCASAICQNWTLRITKGMNALETAACVIGEWRKFSKPVCIGLDASKFDQHITVPLLKMEHRVYLELYSGDVRRYLKYLLKMQLRGKGSYSCDEGQIGVDLPGSRCSGDINTALGNCIVMCVMTLSFALSVHVPAMSVIDNGDDLLIITDEPNLWYFSSLANYFMTNFGVIMKVEPPVSTPEEIEFCQCHPVRTARGWVMVRDVRKSLTKDSTILHPRVKLDQLRAYLGSIGEAGQHLTAGVPVVSAYYDALVRVSGGRRFGEGIGENGFSFLAARMQPRECVPITSEARCSFWLAFGLTPLYQEWLEAYFQEYALSEVVESWRHPLYV